MGWAGSIPLPSIDDIAFPRKWRRYVRHHPKTVEGFARLMANIRAFQVAHGDWRGALAYVLARRAWRSVFMDGRAEWIIWFGRHIMKEIITWPKMFFAAIELRDAIREEPRIFSWYLPMADANKRLIVPHWTPGEHTYTFLHFVDLRSRADVAAYMKAGAPPNVWRFRGARMSCLKQACRYGVLHEKMRRVLEPAVMYTLSRRMAEKLFALIVATADRYRRTLPNASRFFAIATALPIELQQHLAEVVFGAKCAKKIPDRRFRWALARK